MSRPQESPCQRRRQREGAGGGRDGSAVPGRGRRLLLDVPAPARRRLPAVGAWCIPTSELCGCSPAAASSAAAAAAGSSSAPAASAAFQSLPIISSAACLLLLPSLCHRLWVWPGVGSCCVLRPPLQPLASLSYRPVFRDTCTLALVWPSDRGTLSWEQVRRRDAGADDVGWRSLPPLTKPRVGCSVAALRNGAVLVAGGAGDASVELYETYGAPAEQLAAAPVGAGGGAWRMLPPMLAERSGARACTLGDGRVLVLGGLAKGGRVILDSVECFDPASEAWTSLAPMFTGRVNFAACVLPGGAQESFVVLLLRGYPSARCPWLPHLTQWWHCRGTSGGFGWRGQRFGHVPAHSTVRGAV